MFKFIKRLFESNADRLIRIGCETKARVMQRKNDDLKIAGRPLRAVKITGKDVEKINTMILSASNICRTQHSLIKDPKPIVMDHDLKKKELWDFIDDLLPQKFTEGGPWKEPVTRQLSIQAYSAQYIFVVEKYEEKDTICEDIHFDRYEIFDALTDEEEEEGKTVVDEEPKTDATQS